MFKRKHTEKSKKKISESKKGSKQTQETIDKRISKTRGMKRTQEFCDRMSLLNTGKTLSEKTKNKISNTLTGRKRPQEVKDKISNTLKGHPVSDETKKKLKIARKGRIYTEEARKKMSDSHKGKRHSEESIKRVADKNRGKKRTEEFKNRLSELAILRMQNKSNRLKDTKPELETKKILEKYNIIYQPQKSVGNRLYDFYIFEQNLLIEIDGRFYHGKNIKDEDLKYDVQKRCRKTDKIKNKLALKNGFRLLRVWCDELYKLENLIKNNFLGLEYMEVRNCG